MRIHDIQVTTQELFKTETPPSNQHEAMQLQDKDKKKIKDNCKICNKPVKKKDAIQCQGMCKKWAHYKCLCYTPGKIADLKSGVLKILCPCPDCGSPKEIIDEKFKNICIERENALKQQKNTTTTPHPTTTAHPIPNQCECLQQNKTSESTTEDTFMWRKSRFPPYGAPYGFNMQVGNNDVPYQKAQAIRMQSWSLIDIPSPKHTVHKTYQSNVNSPAPPFKSQSSTTVQTSNANFSNNSVAESPGMLDTLEQMCTTVTFLAEQILQIKNKLAVLNCPTTGSNE